MLRNFTEPLRRLLKTPGFSIVAVCILTLAIGICTACFSITNTLVLRTAGFPEGERLVRIFRTNAETDSERHSPANFSYLRDDSKSFEQVVAFNTTNRNIGRVGEVPEVQFGVDFTANALAALRIQPILGRGFAADEDQPGKAAVVLLTQTYWETHYGGDPHVLGQTIRIDGTNVTVIGILPDFDNTTGWYEAKFVRPFVLWPNFKTLRNPKWFDLFARLKPGVSVHQAQAELAVISAQIDHEFPADNGTDGMRVTALGGSEVDGKSRQTYWLTVGLSALVLMIGCGNLANLQLTRFLSRSQDLSVRASLGATRKDLLMPLLYESLTLTLIGGGMGLELARVSNHLVSRFFFDGFPIDINSYVIAFAVFASICTGLTFGLAPAWIAAGTSSGEALKDLSSRSTPTRKHQLFKSLLMVSQVAASIVLVCTALSFAFAIRRAVHSDRGWSSAGLYSVFIDINRSEYSSDTSKRQFYRQLQDGVERLPGIREHTLTSAEPVYGYFARERLVVDGRSPEAPGQEQSVQSLAVDTNYFSLLKIPFRAGENISVNIKAEDPPVAIINESMARLYWPNGDEIGKRIRLVGEEKWCEVIGVVADVRMNPSFEPPYSRLQVYRSIEQFPFIHNSLLLRRQLTPDAITHSLRNIIQGIDPNLMLINGGSVEVEYERIMSSNNLLIYALGSFAVIGLLIALVGLYSVISQATAQRKREFGIRIALGASPIRITRLVVSQASGLVVVGIICGLLGTFYAIEVLQRSMPELRLPETTFEFGIAAILGLVAITAASVPARRATRIDPVECLRAE